MLERNVHTNHQQIIHFTQPDREHLTRIKNGQMFCVCPDFLHLQMSCAPFSALLHLHSSRFHCTGVMLSVTRVGLRRHWFITVLYTAVWCVLLVSSPQLTWDLTYSLQMHLEKILKYIIRQKSKTSH